MERWNPTSSLRLQHRSDLDFYEELRAHRDEFTLVDSTTVQPSTGYGFTARAGEVVRIVEADGPQIGDVTFWSAQDPRERMSSLRTWALEGWFVRPFSRVWSDIPWLRPLVTCIGESVDAFQNKRDVHHHVVASQCSTEQLEMRTRVAGRNSCRMNFLSAIEPFGLTESDIHENLDVFQGFRFDSAAGRFVGLRSAARAGDYIEFYCEMDLIIAISVCPSGAGPRVPATWDDTSLKQLAPYRVSRLRVERYDSGYTPRHPNGLASRQNDP